jgi:quinol-cytochrome oxidoreductase complex cytochrome b subunit
MQVHPVVIIVAVLFLRVVSVAFAAFRILGLGLAGASDMSWNFLPAYALLYFAFAPKPGASEWKYVTVSAVLFIVGSWALLAELHRYPDQAPRLTWMEFGILVASMLLHIIYANWKQRGDWGKWQRV